MTLSNGLQITESLKIMLKSNGINGLTVVNNQTVFIFEMVSNDYDYKSFITYKVADLNGKLKRSREYQQMNDTKVKINNVMISTNEIIIL